MPEIGKPLNLQERAYQNVQMAPRNRAADPNAINNRNQEISDREKERLLNRITGYKPKNDLYVDGKKHNQMGKDEFLKLLTHQLENQDPMNPMKQEKMAAELAQFSQLEQLSNLNNKFDTLAKNKHVEDKFFGASFLDKEVVTTGSSLNFEGEGTDADVLFTLPKPAQKVLVRIFDKNNNMVSEMWKENIGRGNQTISWDGMQLDNSFSGPGEFKTRVFAWDQFAEPIEVKTKTVGKVESVFFENGETVLKVDGKKVYLRDVDSFHAPGTHMKAQKNSAPQTGAPNLNNLKASLGAQLQQSENNAPKNFPVAQGNQAKVNLKKMNNVNGMKSYQEQVPTTGLTSVYDE